MAQHDGLTHERWAAFTVAQQVLMIANELHRALKLVGPDDLARRRGALERVLRLTDLTVAVQSGHSLRRELLRFRDLAAQRYLAPEREPREDAALLRQLLLLTPESARQRGPLGLG